MLEIEWPSDSIVEHRVSSLAGALFQTLSVWSVCVLCVPGSIENVHVHATTSIQSAHTHTHPLVMPAFLPLNQHRPFTVFALAVSWVDISTSLKERISPESAARSSKSTQVPGIHCHFHPLALTRQRFNAYVRSM